MLSKLNHASVMAYLSVCNFFQTLKEDERGLSGVVVAVLLILIAVLAVAAIWAALGTQLQTWWKQITGQTFDPTTLS